MPTAAEVFEQVRQASARGDIEAYLDLLDDDMLMEWMYPYPGFPSQMRGGDRLREFYRGLPARADRRSEFRDVVLHQSTDPEVVIAEFTRDLPDPATGESRPVPYIVVLRVRAGKIVHYRDYFQL
jgi:ketosteroid isomerase-like protein